MSFVDARVIRQRMERKDRRMAPPKLRRNRHRSKIHLTLENH